MLRTWLPRLGFAGHEMGLNEETDGPAFEAILGRYLKFANSLDAIASFGFMGDQTKVVGEGPRSPTSGNFAAWLPTAQGNVSTFNRRLWESLWENFGRDRIDSAKADNAYTKLHELIRSSREGNMPCYIAHATTNFDTAIEVAIQESDYPNTELLDGFAVISGNARPRWAPNLLTHSRTLHDGRIPVVHLHGAVGWYYDPRDQNLIQRRPSDDGYDERLTPALLLPDDTKNPDSFPAPLAEVWEQFKILLREATHIFVIGHSLHDEHLVKAIVEAERPTAVMTLGEQITLSSARSRNLSHVAQAVLGDALAVEDARKRWAVFDPEAVNQIKQLIPNALVIPGAFGSKNALSADFDMESFTKFLDRN